MAHAHDFFEALLSIQPNGRPRLPDLVIPLAPDTTPPLLVYTDAAYSRKHRSSDSDQCDADLHLARLGFVVYDPTALDTTRGSRGLLLYSDLTPSAAVISTFSPNLSTYIAQLEALAALTVYASPNAWSQVGIHIRGRRVNHFIDNTVTISAFTHGYARTTDLARLSNAFHLTLAGMGTHSWLEYVPSLANIADLPSRGKFELLERLGGHRVEVSPISAVDLSAPLHTWIDSGLSARRLRE